MENDTSDTDGYTSDTGSDCATDDTTGLADEIDDNGSGAGGKYRRSGVLQIPESKFLN